MSPTSCSRASCAGLGRFGLCLVLGASRRSDGLFEGLASGRQLLGGLLRGLLRVLLALCRLGRGGATLLLPPLLLPPLLLPPLLLPPLLLPPLLLPPLLLPPLLLPPLLLPPLLGGGGSGFTSRRCSPLHGFLGPREGVGHLRGSGE